MTKTAFITGLNGQDGSYLAELLIEKGYIVHGIIRRSSTINTDRIDHLISDSSIFNRSFFVHYGDVTDPANINELISRIKPDEIYNLAAQSHVKVSFELPHYTAQVDAVGTLNILEAARIHAPKSKIYQASTSELYGGMGYNMPETGYTEDSAFHPRSPYGCAKIYGYWITRNYREAYGMFACSGILFNHESPRRGDTFVTKKITNWIKKAKTGLKSLAYNTDPYKFTSELYNEAEQHKTLIKIPVLELGNINAKRDWGHARDYVDAMWRILQQDIAEDFVIATNATYSVKDFINECFKQLKLDQFVKWEGEGIDEKLVFMDSITIIKINQKYFRPSEVEVLLGDATKARNKLMWTPKHNLEKLVESMLEEK